MEDPLSHAHLRKHRLLYGNSFPRPARRARCPRRLTQISALNLDLRRSHGSGQVKDPGGLHLPGLLKRSADTHRPPNRLDAVMESSARGVEGIMTWTLESLAMVSTSLTWSWSARSRADPARRLQRDSEMSAATTGYRSVPSRRSGRSAISIVQPFVVRVQ